MASVRCQCLWLIKLSFNSFLQVSRRGFILRRHRATSSIWLTCRPTTLPIGVRVQILSQFMILAQCHQTCFAVVRVSISPTEYWYSVYYFAKQNISTRPTISPSRTLALGQQLFKQNIGTRTTIFHTEYWSSAYYYANRTLVLGLFKRKQNTGPRPNIIKTEYLYSAHYLVNRILVLAPLFRLQNTGARPNIIQSEF